MTSKLQDRRDQRDAAVYALRELFPAGSTVQTKLLHVSRSGMLRSFAVLVPRPDGRVADVSGLVAQAIGAKLHTATGGVVMGGCGMDMGYALTYSLSRALFSDGFECTGTRYTTNEGDPEGPRNACPSNDHSNERTPDYTPGRRHSDPGYALAHRHI